MLNQFSRTELLFGKEAMDILENSRVAVFGVGGVGGYTVEARRYFVFSPLGADTVEWIIRAVSFRFENYNYAELCIHYNANQKK